MLDKHIGMTNIKKKIKNYRIELHLLNRRTYR